MSAAVELYEFLDMEPPQPPRRAALDVTAPPYPAGGPGTAADGFRIPPPRPADPTAGGAHNQKGNKP